MLCRHKRTPFRSNIETIAFVSNRKGKKQVLTYVNEPFAKKLRLNKNYKHDNLKQYHEKGQKCILCGVLWKGKKRSTTTKGCSICEVPLCSAEDGNKNHRKEDSIRVGTYGIMRNTSRLQHLKRSQRNQAPGHQLLLAVAQEEKDNVRNLEIIRISSREQIRSIVPLSGFPDVMQILTGNPDMGLILIRKS